MKDDNFKLFKGIGCAMTIVMAIVLAVLMAFCNRIVQNKDFIDNTIEQVHGAVNHVDSVWKGGNDVDTTGNGSAQGVQ